MSWCAGCELHWAGERSAGSLADHVRETGHSGWAWMPMRFELGPPPEVVADTEGDAYPSRASGGPEAA